MRLQLLKRVPSLVSVKVAFAHPLCCVEHDKAFNPMDRRDLHTPSTYQPNLMCSTELFSGSCIWTLRSAGGRKSVLWGKWVVEQRRARVNSRESYSKICKVHRYRNQHFRSSRLRKNGFGMPSATTRVRGIGVEGP